MNKVSGLGNWLISKPIGLINQLWPILGEIKWPKPIVGWCYISLVGSLINTPLGVKIPIAFSREPSSIFRERERERKKRVITSTLPFIPTKSVSRSRFESLGGRIWVYETFVISFFIFTTWIWYGNIWIWGLVFIRIFWIPLNFKKVIFLLCIGFRKSLG